MDKIQGNYTRQTEFPLDEETLVALQNNQALLELLGNIAGDKTIMYGCGQYNNNTMRNPGYVFLRTEDFPEGEILRYEGGSVSAGMYLKKTIIDVNANNVEYAGAYTQRSLAAGLGDESFSWSDFETLHTNTELKALCDNLQAQINLLAPPPLGIVQMWAGSEANIPDGYALCDGRQLNQLSYAALYAVIGSQFNTKKSWSGSTQTTTSGMFRLPDLRGRFIVGKNDYANETEYGTIGNAGGEKKHTLTTNEMPTHEHNLYVENTEYAGIGKHTNIRASISWNEGSAQHPGSTVEYVPAIAGTGGNQSHENRPPYYVLAYIMRLQ